MDNERLYLITDVDGFTPQIGRLVSMMNYARMTTLNTVKGLTTQQLDYLHDDQSNSIGSLLMHLAAVELGYQLETFERRKPNAEELQKWQPAFELGDLGRKEIKGYSLDFYINELDAMRQSTLNEFRKRSDEWLYVESPFWGGKQANHYFMWFHVYEDEINHRGQMRWLRKRAISLC
ncbi:DinB family protein [Paenibacillus sp. sptzw28]|uniref:DinB family protein n=1 Tax=Paenibacillus sp. sptzw28 TaxID=715179 RepID=UPI001C6DDEFE|nr:DinB family protein [Paenibacillus sp. sptzw28]QYR21295.1 DinB family protein [Paenibacillus sp. sptzw28]